MGAGGEMASKACGGLCQGDEWDMGAGGRDKSKPPRSDNDAHAFTLQG